MSDRMHGERWTEAEVEYLRRTFPSDRSINDIAVDLGRTFCAVVGQARKNDLYRPPRCGTKINREQRQFIAKHYANLGSAVLARRFGVSQDWINRLAIRMGVRSKLDRRHEWAVVCQIVQSAPREGYGTTAAAHGMTIGQVAGILHRARRGIYGEALQP